MRNIAYRAYHKKDDCSCGAKVGMYALRNLPLSSYFEVKPYVGFALFDYEKGVFYHEHDSSNLEIMQSTNLKDKNGVEIYEGDILKIVENEAWFSGPKEYEVRYGEGHWEYFMGYKDSKIIGNIYENPDLLESNKA
jgi:hypothetical protein